MDAAPAGTPFAPVSGTAIGISCLPDRPGRRLHRRVLRRRAGHAGPRLGRAAVRQVLPGADLRGRRLHQHRAERRDERVAAGPDGAPARELGGRFVLLVRHPVPRWVARQPQHVRPEPAVRCPTCRASSSSARSPRHRRPGELGPRGHRHHLQLAGLLHHQPGHGLGGQGETGNQSARTYRIQVDTEPSFSAPLLDTAVVDQTTYTAPDQALPRGHALLARPGPRQRADRPAVVRHGPADQVQPGGRADLARQRCGRGGHGAVHLGAAGVRLVVHDRGLQEQRRGVLAGRTGCSPRR